MRKCISDLLYNCIFIGKRQRKWGLVRCGVMPHCTRYTILVRNLWNYYVFNELWNLFSCSFTRCQATNMTSFHTRLHSMSLIVQRSDSAADKSSTRFDYPILAKMFRKFIIRSINVSLCWYHILVILIAGYWAFSLNEKCRNCCRDLDLFWHDSIFANPRTKITFFPPKWR